MTRTLLLVLFLLVQKYTFIEIFIKKKDNGDNVFNLGQIYLID